MLVGRIITGWAVGIMSSAVPVYCAELAHRWFTRPAFLFLCYSVVADVRHSQVPWFLGRVVAANDRNRFHRLNMVRKSLSNFLELYLMYGSGSVMVLRTPQTPAASNGGFHWLSREYQLAFWLLASFVSFLQSLFQN